jgi:DNA-binding HxlR family transcriptional regulator
MSSSMLAKRLRELEDAGLVTTGDDGAYQLTGLGRGLGPALEPLRSWASDWAAATGAGVSSGAESSEQQRPRSGSQLDDARAMPPRRRRN